MPGKAASKAPSSTSSSTPIQLSPKEKAFIDAIFDNASSLRISKEVINNSYLIYAFKGYKSITGRLADKTFMDQFLQDEAFAPRPENPSNVNEKNLLSHLVYCHFTTLYNLLIALSEQPELLKKVLFSQVELIVAQLSFIFYATYNKDLSAEAREGLQRSLFTALYSSCAEVKQYLSESHKIYAYSCDYSINDLKKHLAIYRECGVGILTLAKLPINEEATVIAAIDNFNTQLVTEYSQASIPVSPFSSKLYFLAILVSLFILVGSGIFEMGASILTLGSLLIAMGWGLNRSLQANDLPTHIISR